MRPRTGQPASWTASGFTDRSRHEFP
jgi:hypothetical protein